MPKRVNLEKPIGEFMYQKHLIARAVSLSLLGLSAMSFSAIAEEVGSLQSGTSTTRHGK
jgi:hypothetical protein